MRKQLLRTVRSRELSFLLTVIAFLCCGPKAGLAADGALELASIQQETLPALSRPVPPLIAKESIEYYQISGNCEKDLQNELHKNGVRLKSGKVYDAATFWEMHWDYTYNRSREACSADDVLVTVDVTTRYPKWVMPLDADSFLVAKWEAYQQGLVMHETLHRTMVLEAAADISRALSNLGPVASCDVLDREVRAVTSMRIRQLRRDSNAYDDATGHGLTQGAIIR